MDDYWCFLIKSTYPSTNGRANRPTDLTVGELADRQTDRWVGRQTDKQLNIFEKSYISNCLDVTIMLLS